MQLKEKRTGKLIETEGCIVSGPGFTMSLEAFTERCEIVPEAEKPFEEVAKPKYALKYSVGEHEDGHPSMVGYDYNEERGLHIADRDYYEILPDGTKKTAFTWAEAMEIEKKTDGKWRLPTPKEFMQMVLTYGFNEEGVFEGERFAKALNLTTKVGWGDFWLRSASSTTNARHLLFDGSRLLLQGSRDKVNGFTVRLVRRGEE